MTAALQKPREGWGVLFCEGLHKFTRTGRLVKFLLRRKATINADLNMLWQRWNDMKVCE